MTQVTSLSLSKELWEKGLRIETEKCWISKWIKSEYEKDYYGAWYISFYESTTNLDKQYPAPSTDELLAVMPENLDHKKEYYKKSLHITKIGNLFNVLYYETGISYLEESLAEALGKMCLWLLENGYRYEEKEKCLINLTPNQPIQ